MNKSELEALAARVSDGEPIDWDAVEQQASSNDAQKIVRNLRLVHSLSAGGRASDPSRPIPPEMSASVHESLRDGVARGASDAPESWGGLELREKIGEGAFGDVYRAFDPNLDREVALKLVRGLPGRGPSLASTVLAEGKVLARVVHRNVVTVHGAETHEGVVGLWMEFVRGRSLAEFFDEHGKLSAREASLLGLDLCRALAAVHEAGLVHRDIKAQNVMREEGGRVVLMDFGAAYDARRLEADGMESMAGTPLYIAPEILQGAQASVRSDLYSMGVLMFHLVTGGFPIEARTLAQLKERHDQGRVQLLRDARADLPDGFVRVVQKALARRPEDRYATAGEMEQALAACLGIEPAAAAPSPAARSGFRTPALAALGIGAVLVFGAVLYRTWVAPTPPEQLPQQAARQDLPPAVAVGSADPELDRAPVQPPAPRQEPEREVAAKPAAEPAAPPARKLTPRPSAPVPAAPVYTIEASLFRLDESNRQDRIESGAQLALQDRLWFEFEASRSLYIYVVNRDDQGRGYALFPLPGLDLQNPVPAGRRLRIPGEVEGSPQWWAVNTPGGREEILILASPHRQLDFEAEMARLERPTPAAVPVVEETGDAPVRGIGALAQGANPADAPAVTTARLFAMAETIAGGRPEQADGVWFKKIELVNPTP